MTEATHSVVLRLDPGALENPDLQVRFELEEIVRAEHPDLDFFDDGYGFAQHSDAMMLSYATSEPERLVDALVGVLTGRVVRGNRLATGAMIAVAPRTPDVVAGAEYADHKVVYPEKDAGTPLPD